MREELNVIITAVLNYTDSMEFGDRTTTNRIVRAFGFGNLDDVDLMDIEYEVMKEVKKSRDYILDKSAHDSLMEGLPYNLDFVKISKKK